jgi:peptide/nickel transport system permease protein
MRRTKPGPAVAFILRRLGLGLLTLFLISVIIFVATEVLPGDAARAALGRAANLASLAALRAKLHLDQPVPLQYWHWLIDLGHGSFGTSLVNGHQVSSLVAPRIVNTALLMAIAGLIGVPFAGTVGILAALRQGRRADAVLSVVAFVLAALPEFILGIALILLLATLVVQWLPPVSMVPPGISVLSRPRILVLPSLTLILVIFPYIFRMMRATMIDVLDSDYMEMARLKGLSGPRLILSHAMPNAIAPTLQVVALTFAYLAGGTVMVEYVFGYAGLGQGLMNAIQARDIPVIQFIVLLLAGFYVLLNIAADIAAVLVTPRLRTAGRRPA